MSVELESCHSQRATTHRIWTLVVSRGSRTSRLQEVLGEGSRQLSQAVRASGWAEEEKGLS